MSEAEPEALVTVEELAAKLPFVMSADEQREADLALETLSDDARYYGSVSWRTPEAAPREVKNLILKAANRHMKNYEGFTSSSAGDERVSWSERGEDPEERPSAHFSPSEKDRLRDMGGNRRPGLQSAGMFAYQTRRRRRREGYVPTEPGGAKFQMFCDDEEPW